MIPMLSQEGIDGHLGPGWHHVWRCSASGKLCTHGRLAS